MRRCIPHPKRLLNLIFNGAGDIVPVLNVPTRRHQHVKINPVISPAVSMPQLVIAAYAGLTAIDMGIQNPPQQPSVRVVLLIHQPRRRTAKQAHSRQ